MRKTKLIITCMLLAMSASLSSCTKTDSSKGEATEQESTNDNPVMKSLKMQVEQLNSTMPIDMQEGLKMTAVSIENKYLSFTCEYPESMDFTAPEDDATKKSIVGALPRATLRMLKQADLGIKYTYIQDGTGKKQVIEITPEDIKGF